MKFSYPEGLSISGDVEFVDYTYSELHNSVEHTTLSGVCTNGITLNGDTRYAWPADGVPLYSIIMWSGSAASIPADFAMCSGGTVNGITIPDLRGRFIVGADPGGAGGSYTTGETGGESSVVLTSGSMPQHTHSTTSVIAGSWTNHTHIVTTGEDNTAQAAGPPEKALFVSTTTTVKSAGDHTHTVPDTDSKGASTVIGHSNLPPYYALYFIMKVSDI